MEPGGPSAPAQRLSDDPVHAHSGVERVSRILEDDLGSVLLVHPGALR